ncbi:hypothetical protein D3C81_2332790 [compost metagenome]
MDKETAGRNADLAGISELEAGARAGHGLHVDIVEHHHRRVAAQLHGDRLELLRRQGAEQATNGY